MPTISVIIPVFNRFEYLDEALRSVYAQSVRPEEVIVVDDHSTNSVSDYLQRFPPPGPIRILRTDRNRRVSGARNWGWRHASGELIAFLDSDDLWEPDKLYRQLEYLDKNPEADGVYGSMIAFWPDGRTQHWAQDRPPRVEARYALIDCNIAVQTLLIRRRALEALGGFDERFGILDDQVIALHMAELGRRLDFFANPPLVRHRRHSSNHSSRYLTYFREELLILREHHELCNRIYGPGSSRVRLGRAFRRLGDATTLTRPARILSALLYASAPLSRMPRQLSGNPILKSEPLGDQTC
jgi:glycosyltransferase involved in cell wall biosynthesis